VTSHTQGWGRYESMDDVQGCTNVTEDMDVESDRAKVERSTTAWTQEVEQRMEQLPRMPEPRATQEHDYMARIVPTILLHFLHLGRYSRRGSNFLHPCRSHGGQMEEVDCVGNKQSRIGMPRVTVRERPAPGTNKNSDELRGTSGEWRGKSFCY